MPYQTVQVLKDGKLEEQTSMTPDSTETVVLGYFLKDAWEQNQAGGWDRVPGRTVSCPVYRQRDYWPDGSVTCSYNYKDEFGTMRGLSDERAYSFMPSLTQSIF